MGHCVLSPLQEHLKVLEKAPFTTVMSKGKYFQAKRSLQISLNLEQCVTGSAVVSLKQKKNDKNNQILSRSTKKNGMS